MKLNEKKTYNGDLIFPKKDISSLVENSFQIVNGYVDCSSNKLTTLEGSPEIVKGFFNCSGNLLTSLEGSPEIIEGLFTCSDNKLTSLKGNLKYITGNFHCSKNKKLKNVKEQIIKYQIQAESYFSDEGHFTFEDIKDEFKNYGLYLLKKEQIQKNKELQQKKEQITENLKPLKNKDFGISI